MITKTNHKNITWIDIEDPTEKDISTIAKEYSIPSIVMADMRTHSVVRSKVELFGDILYLALHFPTLQTNKDTNPNQGVAFIVGKEFLITFHKEPNRAIHSVKKTVDVNCLLDKIKFVNHVGFLLITLLQTLYEETEDTLSDIDDEIRRIEKDIFNGNERETVTDVSIVNRRLISFKQAMRSHGHILESFRTAGKYFFGDEFVYHFSKISVEHHKVESSFENHKEIVSELRSTNDSLITNKTNRIIKTLTIITFATLPPTFIIAILSVAVDLEIITFGGTKDIVVTIITLVIVALITLGYFKWKKWF